MRLRVACCSFATSPAWSQGWTTDLPSPFQPKIYLMLQRALCNGELVI